MGLAIFIHPAVTGNLTLQLENDSFDGASDADYTQGIRLAYTSSPPYWAASFLPDRYPGREIRAQYFSGQAIFTPCEVFETELLKYDRPYAGWLYLGAALHSVNLIAESQLATAERFEISASIVGPSSGAEQAQQSLHRVIHTYQVNGWDNQLRDEPTLMLSYARKWAHIQAVADSGFDIEFSGTLGGNLGNVNTALASGIGMRFGSNLYSSVGVSALPPATAAPASEFSSGEGWYLFSEMQLRYIKRDIFLDGNISKKATAWRGNLRWASCALDWCFPLDVFAGAFTMRAVRRNFSISTRMCSFPVSGCPLPSDNPAIDDNGSRRPQGLFAGPLVSCELFLNKRANTFSTTGTILMPTLH